MQLFGACWLTHIGPHGGRSRFLSRFKTHYSYLCVYPIISFADLFQDNIMIQGIISKDQHNTRPSSPTHINNYEALIRIQKERRMMLQEFCAKHPESDFPGKSTESRKDSHHNLLGRSRQSSERTILVDDTHKLVYCFILKSGCTVWKTKLLSLSKKIKLNKERPGGVHSLKMLARCVDGTYFYNNQTLGEVKCYSQREYLLLKFS